MFVKSNYDFYFNWLGWTQERFRLQLKKVNFFLGLFNKAQLEAFIMENLITIEKKSEYEILIPYVDCQTRKLFHATKLINEFPFL